MYLTMWLHGHNCQAPEGAGAVQQRDNICACQLSECLLNEASDDVVEQGSWHLPLRSQVYGCMRCQLLRLACAWTMTASGLQLACDWVLQYVVLIHANIVELP